MTELKLGGVPSSASVPPPPPPAAAEPLDPPLPPRPPLHVVFVHLDLGIGGAEQLVLQLASASQDLGYRVDIVTARCDQDRCFAAVKKTPAGRLCSNVYVYGRWIPADLFGLGTALMSTVRMLYIAYQVTRLGSGHRSADVVVLDVLPTPLPLLLGRLPSAGALFYCHFPDKLLPRDATTRGGAAGRWYRRLLDATEELTMGLADTLVVNSLFTLGQVREHFPSLDSDSGRHQQQSLSQQQSQQRRPPIQVLYPALDTSNMVQPNDQEKTGQSPIVSLNRFERKKNVGLLIEAYAYMMRERGADGASLPPLVVAGGYDTQNVENVEYRAELGALAGSLGVPVNFRTDISDAERASLFQSALCVVYTPDREHFGIVPLEAMYAGTPVLAVRSGGPTETVRDGVTGFLRDPTPEDFGRALLELIGDPERATKMGRAGREHVEETFGPRRFQEEWKVLVEETKRRSLMRRQGRSRRPELVWWVNASLYATEALTALVVLLAITFVLRWLEVLEEDQYIPSALRSIFTGGEL